MSQKRFALYFNLDNPRDRKAWENLNNAYNKNDYIKNLLAGNTGTILKPSIEFVDEPNIEKEPPININENEIDNEMADI